METHNAADGDIWNALRTVIDPEIGLDIVTLGLVYDVAVDTDSAVPGDTIHVTHTLTTPGCPMHESIRWGAQTALLQLSGVEEAEVEIVWDPPWHPSMMTEAGRNLAGQIF